MSEVAVDGSLHKAPFGGEGTGPSPVDRGKCGWKWSIAADRNGIPLCWEIAGANRQDSVLLAPTLDSEDFLKDIDFSAAGIRARWQAGVADTLRMLERAPWDDPVDPREGVVVHELSARTGQKVLEYA